MLLFVTAALAAALLIALGKLWFHHLSVRSLYTAIQKKQPLLRENFPGTAGDYRDRLREATNELIAEVGHLQRLRSSQLAQLSATLGSLQEAVLILDADNYVLLANKALQDIFPRATNTLGQRLEGILHSVDLLRYVDAVRQTTAQPQQEIEFVDSRGSTWVEVTGSTIPALDGQPRAWALFVLHDITKQKKLELIRKEFVANVSHELRTPLSVIKGYTETLVDGHNEMPVSDRDRFLKTIQRHTERLNSLLEDLLTLSRLESINPGLLREPTDLNALLGGVVDDYRARPAAAEHILNLKTEPVGELQIDPLKISQVLENLLDNALKYSAKGSEITLSASVQPGEVEISVIDNGQGIPEADLPHVFERFYRVDKGRSREKGGTGLGLSIVKHIVQLHGGRVWVKSKLGQGTAFYFSLPLRPNGSSSASGR